MKQTIHTGSEEDTILKKEHEQLIDDNSKIPTALKEKCSASYLEGKQDKSCVFSREDVFQAKLDAEADLLEKSQKQDPSLKRINKVIICGVTF